MTPFLMRRPTIPLNIIMKIRNECNSYFENVIQIRRGQTPDKELECVSKIEKKAVKRRNENCDKNN